MSDEQNKPVAEAVDINSMDLAMENLEGLDTEKDQFASLPVVDDGTYRAKLVQKKPNNDIDAFWIKNHTKPNKGNKPYLQTAIEARIIDPNGKFDDWPVFDNFVSTLVSQMTGTNKIVGILKQALRQSVPARVQDVELAKLLNDSLAGEPTVGITTQQEAYCPTCEKTKAKGQKRFRKDKPFECPTCGTECQIQARIIKYVPEDAVPAHTAA